MVHFQRMLKAAAKGDPEAQHDLAATYATDDSWGIRNETKAINWYMKAAARGHGQSQYDLGFMLILGEGTEKNIQKGLWWMEQAVANGYEYAASVLSEIYEGGFLGVEANSEKAAYWKQQADGPEVRER
jgi:TPR repeat protein